MGFKGGRTYLHGTSFFTAIEEVSPALYGQVGGFVSRLVFRHLARHLCEISSLPPDDSELLVGQGRYRGPGGAENEFWLIETCEPVIDRQPWNEDELATRTIFCPLERSAHLIERSSNTPIEDVVGLTKLLNYKLMPDISGKWLFGQLDLKMPLQYAYNRLDIRMMNAFAGKFSVSEILLDKVSIGTIRFIVGEG